MLSTECVGNLTPEEVVGEEIEGAVVVISPLPPLLTMVVVATINNVSDNHHHQNNNNNMREIIPNDKSATNTMLEVPGPASIAMMRIMKKRRRPSSSLTPTGLIQIGTQILEPPSTSRGNSTS